MSNATAAGVFIAVSLVVIAAAWLDCARLLTSMTGKGGRLKE